MDKYRQEVLEYLNHQEDSYFACLHTTRQIVLADTERIDLIAAEHKKCVEQFGCDPTWSLQDACDNDPGITSTVNAPLSFEESVAYVANKLLTAFTSQYAADIWQSIDDEVIAIITEQAANNNGSYSDDDVRRAIGKVITKHITDWAYEV